MVERSLLTKGFVESVSAPTHGERWIADTEIRGFGLRLWANKSGGQKAYAIRTTDRNGRKVRRTFNTDTAWSVRLQFAYGSEEKLPSLGDYLEDARNWAKDTIDHLKGRPTIGEEYNIGQARAKLAVRRMTLEAASASLLNGMRAAGRSTAYTDRLDKLFSSLIPRKLKETKLSNLSPKRILSVLTRSKAPLGNVFILRAFINQLFSRAQQYDGPLGHIKNEINQQFVSQIRKYHDVRFPELRKLKDEDFRTIFESLEDEPHYWQQALCIRLFFEFKAPLQRVMTARWNQIFDGYWYPYFPREKVYWFESREQITENANRLLRKIARNCNHGFGSSIFWFPSRHADGANHIRSVDTVWRATLKKSGLAYFPVREFSRSFREPNRPSYYISFLRQYGEIFRHEGNMAEVSKSLATLEKKPMLSTAYR